MDHHQAEIDTYNRRIARYEARISNYKISIANAQRTGRPSDVDHHRGLIRDLQEELVVIRRELREAVAHINKLRQQKALLNAKTAKAAALEACYNRLKEIKDNHQ